MVNGESVLEVNDLTKKYGDKTIVSNISFDVREGEVFGFLGKNGAGKSTTMKMICGLTSISDGDIYICGKNISTNFERAISNLGGMIETPNMYEYMTGFQNLKYFAKLHSNISKQRIYDVAELVGLRARLKDKVSKYSLGMKQRLGIAQAILHSPRLLVLDEPTNGLDANGIREIKMFLKSIAKTEKVAIMVSSHLLSIMESLCDRVAIINDGRIAEISTIEELKKRYGKFGNSFVKVGTPNYAGKLIEQQLGSSALISENKVMFSCSEKQLADIIVLLTQKKVVVYAAGEIDYSLEDIYINIVGDNNSIA